MIKNKVMTQEDYCSYEVAKLLKEKGFDSDEVGCLGGFYSESCYESGHGITTQSGQEVGIVYDDLTNADLEHDEYLRPTHQMAMKWLREEKNILLYVYPVINLPVKDDYTLFHWRWDGKKKIHAAPHFGDKHHNYESYEEAVEAALKHSLENII